MGIVRPRSLHDRAPVVDRIEADKRAQQLCPTRTEQTPQPHDLAGFERKGHILEGVSAAEAFDS